LAAVASKAAGIVGHRRMPVPQRRRQAERKPACDATDGRYGQTTPRQMQRRVQLQAGSVVVLWSLAGGV
jgi:hypothetical protein